MHKKALGEDPSVFDYDGHYDELKEKIARPRVQDKTERKVCASLRSLIAFVCCLTLMVLAELFEDDTTISFGK